MGNQNATAIREEEGKEIGNDLPPEKSAIKGEDPGDDAGDQSQLIIPSGGELSDDGEENNAIDQSQNNKKKDKHGMEKKGCFESIELKVSEENSNKINIAPSLDIDEGNVETTATTYSSSGRKSFCYVNVDVDNKETKEKTIMDSFINFEEQKEEENISILSNETSNLHAEFNLGYQEDVRSSRIAFVEDSCRTIDTEELLVMKVNKNYFKDNNFQEKIDHYDATAMICCGFEKGITEQVKENLEEIEVVMPDENLPSLNIRDFEKCLEEQAEVKLEEMEGVIPIEMHQDLNCCDFEKGMREQVNMESKEMIVGMQKETYTDACNQDAEVFASIQEKNYNQQRVDTLANMKEYLYKSENFEREQVPEGILKIESTLIDKEVDFPSNLLVNGWATDQDSNQKQGKNLKNEVLNNAEYVVGLDQMNEGPHTVDIENQLDEDARTCSTTFTKIMNKEAQGSESNKILRSEKVSHKNEMNNPTEIQEVSSLNFDFLKFSRHEADMDGTPLLYQKKCVIPLRSLSSPGDIRFSNISFGQVNSSPGEELLNTQLVEERTINIVFENNVIFKESKNTTSLLCLEKKKGDEVDDEERYISSKTQQEVGDNNEEKVRRSNLRGKEIIVAKEREKRNKAWFTSSTSCFSNFICCTGIGQLSYEGKD